MHCRSNASSCRHCTFLHLNLFLLSLAFHVISVNSLIFFFFFFSSRRRHTRSLCDWSSDVCSSDLVFHDSSAGIPVPSSSHAMIQKPGIRSLSSNMCATGPLGCQSLEHRNSSLKPHFARCLHTYSISFAISAASSSDTYSMSNCLIRRRSSLNGWGAAGGGVKVGDGDGDGDGVDLFVVVG